MNNFSKSFVCFAHSLSHMGLLYCSFLFSFLCRSVSVTEHLLLMQHVNKEELNSITLLLFVEMRKVHIICVFLMPSQICQ
jgi:hypothetical protein